MIQPSPLPAQVEQPFSNMVVPTNIDRSSSKPVNEFQATRQINSSEPPPSSQDIQKEILELRKKVMILEERVNQPSQPQSVLEGVLGMAWHEIVLMASLQSQPNAPLYNMIQSVAPNVITSSSLSLPCPNWNPSVPAASAYDGATTYSTRARDKGKQPQHSRADSAYQSL